MSNDLAIYEQALVQHQPQFAQALEGTGLPAIRLIRTVMMAIEDGRSKLREATLDSIVRSAMTAGVLGLEVDGVTGQGFIIPYSGKAQFQIGYKGYPTIAARSGFSINSGIIREGDTYDFQEGSKGYVTVRKSLEPRGSRKILAAWSVASHKQQPDIVRVMSYSDILAIKAKSKAAAKSDSPWNDIAGPGHEAMCAKTAVRQLGRNMPMKVVQQAVALEDLQDRADLAYLGPNGELLVDRMPGNPYPTRQPEPDGKTFHLEGKYVWVLGNGVVKRFHTIQEWGVFVRNGLGRSPEDAKVQAVLRNQEHIGLIVAMGQESEIADILRLLASAGGHAPDVTEAEFEEVDETFDPSMTEEVMPEVHHFPSETTMPERTPSPTTPAPTTPAPTTVPPTPKPTEAPKPAYLDQADGVPFAWSAATYDIPNGPKALIQMGTAIEKAPTSVILDKVLSDLGGRIEDLKTRNATSHEKLMNKVAKRRSELNKQG